MKTIARIFFKKKERRKNGNCHYCNCRWLHSILHMLELIVYAHNFLFVVDKTLCTRWIKIHVVKGGQTVQ